MQERIIIAGHGGQGVMFLGKLLAQAAMEEGKNVTYLPSYGTEVRGGTAHCQVVISSEEICSPVVERPTTLVVMNQPSYDRFLPLLAPAGTLFANSSLVAANPEKKNAYCLPVTAVAAALGEVQVANMVMLGALNGAKQLVSRKLILKLLAGRVAKGSELWKLNGLALARGEELCKQGG